MSATNQRDPWLAAMPLSADEQAVLTLYHEYELCRLEGEPVRFVRLFEEALSQIVGEPVTALVLRKRHGEVGHE